MDDYNQEEVQNSPKHNLILPSGSDPYSDPIAGDITKKDADYYSNPYATPIPPSSNIKKVHSYRRYQIEICTFLIGCIVGATILFFNRQAIPRQNTATMQQQTIHPTLTALNQPKSMTQSSTSTTPGVMIAPTPTLDAVQAMQSPDFDTYIKGFAEEASAKQYDAITKATDTNNFQSLALYADGGTGNWQGTYDQLVTGNLSFLIQYPTITAAQEGYNCNNNYSSQGLPPWIVIHNSRIMYVVGTIQEPNTSATQQSSPNSTVFIFEQSSNGYMSGNNPWYWRGYVLNNVAGCLNSPMN